mmetsp:Transcript_147337/g.282349  ORF Transcript_147337/g.282349 Transcript_147337/m.282349 type:complete len:418 (+) Transcript_147337:206-1459(+)
MDAVKDLHGLVDAHHLGIGDQCARNVEKMFLCLGQIFPGVRLLFQHELLDELRETCSFTNGQNSVNVCICITSSNSKDDVLKQCPVKEHWLCGNMQYTQVCRDEELRANTIQDSQTDTTNDFQQRRFALATWPHQRNVITLIDVDLTAHAAQSWRIDDILDHLRVELELNVMDNDGQAIVLHCLDSGTLVDCQQMLAKAFTQSVQSHLVRDIDGQVQKMHHAHQVRQHQLHVQNKVEHLIPGVSDRSKDVDVRQKGTQGQRVFQHIDATHQSVRPYKDSCEPDSKVLVILSVLKGHQGAFVVLLDFVVELVLEEGPSVVVGDETVIGDRLLDLMRQFILCLVLIVKDSHIELSAPSQEGHFEDWHQENHKYPSELLKNKLVIRDYTQCNSKTDQYHELAKILTEIQEAHIPHLHKPL